MKTIIIRDDDVSFFTPPALLETIYTRLWEAKIPVCFAVIPAPRGDVKVVHREGHPWDPSIPKQYRGQAKEFRIADNSEICDFLNEKVRAGLVEVCQHGYNHSYYEFRNEDEAILTQKINDGFDALQTALPDANIRTFIAPYDEISPTAFKLLEEHDFTICTQTSSLKETPYADMQTYQERAVSKTRHLYTVNDYFFSRHCEPETCLSNAENSLREQDLVILVNHYWTFFYDWNGNWQAMLDAWNRYIDQLLALPNLKFKTFSSNGNA